MYVGDAEDDRINDENDIEEVDDDDSSDGEEREYLNDEDRVVADNGEELNDDVLVDRRSSTIAVCVLVT